MVKILPQAVCGVNYVIAPTIVKYSASPTYQIIGLSIDCKTSDTASSLNTNSNLVKALGGGASGCAAGLSAVGGVSTFYADVITAAQTALTTNGRTGVQKVIIFLSDGDANASSSNVPTGKASNQCHEGITAAQAATAAGAKVYSLAYGAQTSGTCSTDSPAISACQAMQQIASTSSMFFSDKQNGSTTCASSVNSVSELSSVRSGRHCHPPDCFPIARLDGSAWAVLAATAQSLLFAAGPRRNGPRAPIFPLPWPSNLFS